jgi:hypothetical protein
VAGGEVRTVAAKGRRPHMPRETSKHTERPEHKHQEDHRFGKTAAAREEQADRMLDETDGDPSRLQDAEDAEDEPGGRREPHAGGRA